MDTRPVEALLQELGLGRPSCRHVLLVDDEFEVLAVLEALLEDDWEVHTAQGGEEAIGILEGDDRIDLVITDQRMPGMTGVELLAVIAERWPDTYRIVLTAYSDVDPIVAAINRGSVDRFILKPWDPEGLREQVREGLTERTNRLTMHQVAQALASRHQAMNRTLGSLRDAQKRAGASEHLAVLDWMSSGLTSELETLLISLEHTLRTLDLSTADPDVVAAADNARDTLGRVHTLLGDMRRLDDATLSTEERKPTDPRKLISEAVRQLIDEDIGNNNPVHVQIEPDVGEISVSPAKIRLAILGLLRNATRASPPDTPVQVRVRKDPAGLTAFEVADRGTGMTPEVLQQAVRPFFSAFDPPGNGLGLAICRMVAEAHGGRLALLDNPPNGVLAQLWLGPDAAKPSPAEAP